MNNYLGARCPVCEKKFTQDDDIVVCPVCGAPHHRACYALENQCAFEKEHITGKPWKQEIVQSPEQPAGQPSYSSVAQEGEGDVCFNPQDGRPWDDKSIEVKTCQVCGSRNPKDNLYCCSCGNRMLPDSSYSSPPNMGGFGSFNPIDPTAAIYGGVLPTDIIGEHTARDTAVYVRNSSSYYIPRFKNISSKEGAYTYDFNFSAFLFTFFYFLYRKMYKFAAVVLAISLLISIPSFLLVPQQLPLQFVTIIGEEALIESGYDPEAILAQSDPVELEKYSQMVRYANIVNIVFKMAVGMFANYLYYKHTQKEMSKIKKSNEAQGGTNLNYESGATRLGGVSWSLVLALLFVFAGVLTIYTINAAAGFQSLL